MDPEGRTFGRGPRELTGAVDLLNCYKLLVHHDFFCKRALPSSISATHYLHNVVGDTEIRKGQGMELDQLFQNRAFVRETNPHIQPFDLETLNQAFQLRETEPIELPSAEKGIPTITGKSKSESKDRGRKHNKHKDRDKEHKRHKHRHKDRSKDKGREKRERSGNHAEKKRKHDKGEDFGDTHEHRKRKHKSSKGEEVGKMKVGS